MAQVDAKLTDVLLAWLTELVAEQPGLGLSVGSRVHEHGANIWPLFSMYAMDGPLSVIILAGRHDKVHLSLYDMRSYEGNNPGTSDSVDWDPAEPGRLDEAEEKIKKHLRNYALRERHG